MKTTLIIITLILCVFTMNAQVPDFNEIKEVPAYQIDGSTTIFDIHQPVRNLSQEDAVIATNKCIRWLFLSDYYAIKSLDIEGSAKQMRDTRFTLKSALYAKLYKQHNCITDDYERFDILKKNWYINLEEELFSGLSKEPSKIVNYENK